MLVGLNDRTFVGFKDSAWETRPEDLIEGITGLLLLKVALFSICKTCHSNEVKEEVPFPLSIRLASLVIVLNLGRFSLPLSAPLDSEFSSFASSFSCQLRSPFFAILLKNFYACDLVCGHDRVLMYLLMEFQFFPKLSKPSKNR